MISKLAILNYHGIESGPGEYGWLDEETPYVIQKKELTKQLDFLKQSGYTSLTLQALQSRLQGRESHSPSVMITFDDGHRSHYDHAMGCLKKCGFSGLFFISAGFVGHPAFMSWDQLREMLQQGMELGSHGISHIALPQLSDSQLQTEVKGSKTILEQKLGIEIKSFSIPRGFYHPRIRQAVEKAGYQFLFTSQFGLNLKNQDRFYLRRLAIKSDTAFETFEKWAAGNLGVQRYVEEIKSGLRQILPPRLYDWAAKMKRGMTG